MVGAPPGSALSRVGFGGQKVTLWSQMSHPGSDLAASAQETGLNSPCFLMGVRPRAPTRLLGEESGMLLPTLNQIPLHDCMF